MWIMAMHTRRRNLIAVVSSVAVVAFIAVTFGARWSAVRQNREEAEAMTGGDIARAPESIRRYGCGGCHTIPGVPGGDGQVGGPLSDLRKRVYIGGVLENTPDHLVGWIVNPKIYSPRSAMPASGITVTEAKDVAAFLYTK
jgi:cytochrome c